MLTQAKKAAGPRGKHGLTLLLPRQQEAAAMPCRHRHWAFRTGALLVLVAMTACTGRERLAAVPSALTEEATVLGIANARPVRDRHAYVIRNARLDPEWSSVDRRLLSITGRAISTMIHYSGYNDVFRIYASSQLDGIDFNLAYIGEDFTTERKENFDQAYMRALFEYGYQQAHNGYHWFKQPPVTDMPDGRPNVDAER